MPQETETYECRTPEGKLSVGLRNPDGTRPSMLDAELKAQVNQLCDVLRDGLFTPEHKHRVIQKALFIAQELRRELEIREGEIALGNRERGLWDAA